MRVVATVLGIGCLNFVQNHYRIEIRSRQQNGVPKIPAARNSRRRPIPNYLYSAKTADRIKASANSRRRDQGS